MTINNSYNLVCTDGTVYHAKKENKTGSGGNSIVLEIDELPNCVAKIYESEPNNELRVKRFKYELEVMEKLSKAQYSVVPKIIAKGLIDSNNDHPFFIMEKHQTFKNKKPFLNNYSFENKVDLLIKICDKLMFIHKKGIYHRDIKPDNILFDSSTNDEPLLCDFGLAISDDRSINIKTWDNENLGSYTFRPPELIGHHKNMRPSDYVWSDIYQFGKTAYAILKSCPKSFSDGCQIIDEDLEIDIYKDNLRIEYVYSMIEKSIVYDFHERITLQECKNELLKAKEAYQIDKTKLERNRFIRRVKGKISKAVNSTFSWEMN